MTGLARDYDHFDPALLPDPYAFWAALRDGEPVAHSDQHGGFWVISRYADIMAAACDPATFSSQDGTGTPPIPIKLLPIDTDPPNHQKYRKVINPSFTPAAVRAQEGEWRTLAKELVADLPADAPVELCEAFAVPFPQQVALRMIGFPDDDRADLAGWIDDITRLRGIDDGKVAEASVGVMTRIIQRLAERREEKAPSHFGVPPLQTSATEERQMGEPGPRGDLIDVLLEARVDDRPLDDNELLFSMMLLLLGGLDTTTSAISFALAHLADRPEDCARLLADPELLDTAVEEFVRLATPVQGLGRTVTTDTTVSGCPLHQGDRVFLLWASGNRDPEAFDRPDEAVLDRHPNHHLGFGAGPHRCVGSHAGKLMVKIALQELLPWLGGYRIVEEPGWVGGETRGIRRLVVERGISA